MDLRHKLSILGCLLGLLALLSAGPPQRALWADEDGDSDYHGKPLRSQFILKAAPEDIKGVVSRIGFRVLAGIDPQHDDLVLVEASPALSAEQVESLVSDEAEVIGFEPARLATLPEHGDFDLEQSVAVILEQSVAVILESAAQIGSSQRDSFNRHFDTSAHLWRGYTDQPAAQLLNLHAAHRHTFGSGVVAVIDTGVDPGHPVLADALLPGYDFILDRPGIPSEWAGLDQSVAVILEQARLDQSVAVILEGAGTPVILNQSVAVILEQSVAVILESLDLPPAFGHGTMVAGVIRLVAPGASIMPLRAFDAEGNAHLFDIVRAIYYAVDHGADVINMSFSTDFFSPEVMRAVNYASNHGVVCVASAGNRSQTAYAYPGALGNTLGIASTSLADSRSAFTNFGQDLVTLAAPGESIVSTFPGGIFAAGFGTSFSAPFVSGTAALLHGARAPWHPRGTAGPGLLLTRSLLVAGAQSLPTADLGAGRLDILETLASNRRLHSDDD